MPLGISYLNVDPTSYLALRSEEIIYPPAADDDYFATAASNVIAAAVAGDSLTLTTPAARPLFNARNITVTPVDASGSDLAVTLKITGRRFGFPVTESISVTGTTLGRGTEIFDEVTSIVITSIANAAASDAIKVGFDNRWVGLKMPFNTYKDVKMVFKVAAGTPDIGGPKTGSDITAAMVNGQRGAINLYALYGNTNVAATDHYLIEVNQARGAKARPSWLPLGYRFGG
jgi:hypothetical protein